MPFSEKCKAKSLHKTGSLSDELKGIQRTYFTSCCVRFQVYLIHMHVSKVIIVNNMLKQQRSVANPLQSFVLETLSFEKNLSSNCPELLLMYADKLLHRTTVEIRRLLIRNDNDYQLAQSVTVSRCYASIIIRRWNLYL